jgi:hypothetical protein
MNPWIDVGLWAVVIVSIIFLRYEVPRAVREIRKILDESRAINKHIRRGE